MKNLNENQILQHLSAQRTELKVTHEEITSPAYEVWGRARGWLYHQGVCLLAGLTPAARPYFDLLVGEGSVLQLVDWFEYYPAQVTDRNRLQNIDRLLQTFPLASEAKKINRPVSPKELLALCKNHPDIAPFLPPDLIEVVDKYGPHPSLNLPSTFCSLEIDPSMLENLKKFKKRKNMPLALSSIDIKKPKAMHHKTFHRIRDRIRLLDDLATQTQQTRVLATGTERNVEGMIPQIIETTLVFTRTDETTRIITHLHYTGWTDRHVAPDEQLLDRLLRRMQELSPNPRRPIGINCAAGRGRSLNIAIDYFARKKIDAGLRRGESIYKMRINFPEIAYQFHKQRDLDLRSVSAELFVPGSGKLQEDF